MGQVYQATDTTLDRDVALKVLPDAFTADPDRLARFEREAKVLASLNHPNIAAIYGLEEADGVRALVLELVEGPTLADRIKQGPIPLDEALPIAKQIAEALEAAHEAGVIHRDLKPANIKVREDGTVKVLDFGLAKALAGDVSGTDLSQSPTVTASGTREGVILGTAAYMSPEQARGKLLDRCTDIWSFGCVLYEILTGRSPFLGETLSDTIAKVLDRDPDWQALPTNTPALLRRLLRRCLDKDPRERLRDIGDARVEIREAMTAPLPESTAAVPAAPRSLGWRGAMPWVAGVTLAVVTGFAAWSLMRPSSGPPTRLTVAVPEGLLQLSNPMLSPDGRTIAFDGVSDGQRQVYVRRLDQLDAVPVRGAEGASLAGFSPDGEWLLFSTSQQPGLLKRVPLTGGPAITIATLSPRSADEAFGSDGADWGPDDTIVQGSPEGLWAVPAAGGNRTQLTTIAGGPGHRRPKFLPSGRAVLYYQVSAQSERQVAVYDFDTGEGRALLPGTSPQFASSGHLVFWRDNALWAVPFDPDALEIRGDPSPVVEGVQANPTNGYARYDVGTDGTLLYTRGGDSDRRSLVWVDRTGVEEPVDMTPRDFDALTLSPDGKQLVVSVGGVLEGGNLYRYDLERHVEEQVTFSGADLRPEWSPDGSRIAFSSRREGQENLYIMAADGTGTATRLTESPFLQSVSDWFPDGESLLVVEVDDVTGVDIATLRIGSGGQSEKLLQTDADESLPVITSNGRWMAYTSDESGQVQIYVRPFPDVTRGSQRLIGPGTHPVWGPEGRELFYRIPSDRFMVVDVETGDTFERGTPRQLFPDTYYFSGSRNWALTPDDRFLIVTQGSATSVSPEIIVIQNWVEELTRLVPVP